MVVIIKIALVVPFSNFIEQALEVFERHNRENQRPGEEEYTLEELVVRQRDLSDLCIDADAIIARGLYADILKNQNRDTPIIEIVVQGNDMLNNLLECRVCFGKKRVAVIASQSMVYDVEEMAQRMSLDIRAYGISQEIAVEEMVRRAIQDGCQVVLGGTSSCEVARQYGLESALIKTGKKSFYQSLTEAKRATKISRRAQRTANVYKAILDYTYSGILALDQEQRVAILNNAAKEILGIDRAVGVGVPISSFPVSKEIMALLENNQEYINEIILNGEEQLMFSKVQVGVKGIPTDYVITMQKIKHIQKMEEDIRKKLIGKGHDAKSTFDDIVSVSPITKEIVRVAKRYSMTNSNILLTGQSGTGKEIFAQSIHNNSQCRNGPFVAVNCASLPEHLLESELFGYVAGAFTGALKTGKMGFFGLAHNGTIFLDEIAEMPLQLQAKLLRVLQEKQFVRLGDDKVVHVTVRVIAATNKDLYEMVKAGEFREDLFYRLNVLQIHLPDIEHRKEDIPVLAEQFIRRQDRTKSLSDEAKQLLQSYRWEGNVRQIHNFCERIEALTTSQIITADEIRHIQELTEHQQATDLSLQAPEQPSEKDRILTTLEQCKYNRQKAAQLLGMSRSTLWRKMREYQIHTM